MADYSCYITIINNTYQTLTRNEYVASWGYWVTYPPVSIIPKQTIDFRLADSSGWNGSTGSVEFVAAPGALFKMAFNDPYASWENNSCSITKAGPAASLYRISFEAKSGSGGWQPTCPPTGHPLYVKFTISKDLPRPPKPNELNELMLAYPKLDKSSVLVLGERTNAYNSIAWSLGINYTWINPPPELVAFQKMYLTAADSVHTPVDYLAWRASSNWSAVDKGDLSAIIDGWGLPWGTDGTRAPGPVTMTHASRRFQSADRPAAVWTSKVGENLLITHDRFGLESKVGGELQTSFVPVLPIPPSLMAELEGRHTEMTAPQFFTAADRGNLDDALEAIASPAREEFAELYGGWLGAIAEKMSLSSDTRDGARLPEFDALVALGAGILPLVVERICVSPTTNFRLAVLYDALQQQPGLKVRYSPDDPYQFEGEPARAARSAKLWLGARAPGRTDGAQ